MPKHLTFDIEIISFSRPSEVGSVMLKLSAELKVVPGYSRLSSFLFHSVLADFLSFLKFI